MEWTVHARLGGEPTAFSCDGEEIAQAGEGWQPRDDVFGWTRPGEKGPRLTFSLLGEGPGHDLLVRQGKKKVAVSGLHVTHSVFAWIESMDGACLLTGDPGYDRAERIVVLDLGPIRDALAAGEERIDGDGLSHIRVVAGRHHLDLSADSIMLIPADGGLDLAIAWNVPRTNPPESRLKVLSFAGWTEGMSLESARISSSDTLEFDNLWMTTGLVRTHDDGTHAIDVLGSTRRRVEFQLAAQSVRSDTPLPMAKALRGADRSTHGFSDVELRNAGSLQKAFPLAGSERILATIETPRRERKLVMVTLGDDPSVDELDVDKVPFLTTVEPGAPDSAVVEDEDDTELDDDAIHLDAGDVREIPLGTSDAVPSPSVWVVRGDAAGARLQSWLGRDGDEWTLYVAAEANVAVQVD